MIKNVMENTAYIVDLQELKATYVATEKSPELAKGIPRCLELLLTSIIGLSN